MEEKDKPSNHILGGHAFPGQGELPGGENLTLKGRAKQKYFLSAFLELATEGKTVVDSAHKY